MESKEKWKKEEERRRKDEEREKEEENRRERERREEQRQKVERATLLKAIIITASVAALLGLIAPNSLYFILFVVAWAIVTYPFARLKSFWIRCVLYVIAPIVVLAATIWLKDRYEAQRLDHEVKWRSIKPYDINLHGVEIGDLDVPGSKKFVRFYMGGPDDDDDHEVGGEMLSNDLSKMAKAAWDHGYNEVVLSPNKPTALAMLDIDAEAAFDEAMRGLDHQRPKPSPTESASPSSTP